MILSIQEEEDINYSEINLNLSSQGYESIKSGEETNELFEYINTKVNKLKEKIISESKKRSTKDALNQDRTW